jgi:hypothetical protein
MADALQDVQLPDLGWMRKPVALPANLWVSDHVIKPAIDADMHL